MFYSKWGPNFITLRLSSLPGLPLVRDPLDARYTEVRSSSIHGAGEGLFARRNVEAYTIVSVYSGLTMSKDQYMTAATLIHSKDSSNLVTPNAIGLDPDQVTDYERKYVLSLIRLWTFLSTWSTTPRVVTRQTTQCNRIVVMYL